MRGFILVAGLLASGFAFGHGGGLDASGCHTNRKTGSFHCHGARAPRTPRAQSKPLPVVENRPPAKAASFGLDAPLPAIAEPDNTELLILSVPPELRAAGKKAAAKAGLTEEQWWLKQAKKATAAPRAKR